MAIKEDKQKIEKIDIDKAYLKIIAGDEKKDKTAILEKDREITAYHEAGHAVVTKYVDDDNTVAKISIIPTTKGVGGFCLNIFKDKLFHTKQDLEHQIMIAYGGRASEEIMFGKDNITVGASNDIEKATNIIQDYVCKYGMSKEGMLNYTILGHKEDMNDIYKKISQELYEKTKQILLINKKYLENLAMELIENETLDEQQINKIFV